MNKEISGCVACHQSCTIHVLTHSLLREGHSLGTISFEISREMLLAERVFEVGLSSFSGEIRQEVPKMFHKLAHDYCVGATDFCLLIL